MSIPDRLWRVVRGHWALANESVSEAVAELRASETSPSGPEARVADATRAANAEADAYRELTALLRQRHADTAAAEATAVSTGGTDRLSAAYAVLGLQGGQDLNALDLARDARRSEVRPEQHPAGSPARAVAEEKLRLIDAAYERVRDVLNPTETRFERLEF